MKPMLILSYLLLAATASPAQEPLGPCRFDTAALSFAGTPAEQAECLMRKVVWKGELKPQKLPKVLHALLSGEHGPPAPFRDAALAAFPEHYRAYAAQHAQAPVSITEEGLPLLYFVIHDTSMPFLGREVFPKRLDSDLRVNDLTPYVREDPVGHIFLNRSGQIWPGHDFAENWRATKFETRVIGYPARGRFTHIELVQPRRYARGSASLGDTLAPRPGFSREQYRQLAALYVYASARAGHWLIPAQHATLDAGLEDAHDDPQNFEIKAFARELELLINPRRKQPQSPAAPPFRHRLRPHRHHETPAGFALFGWPLDFEHIARAVSFQLRCKCQGFRLG